MVLARARARAKDIIQRMFVSFGADKKTSPLTHGIDLHCFFIVNNACRSGSTATPTSAHEKKQQHNTKTNIQKQIAAERMQNIESSNRPK